jgi:hypothetical protein
MSCVCLYMFWHVQHHTRHAYMYGHTFTCVKLLPNAHFVCIHVHMYMLTYVCIHIKITHIHIHTCIHTARTNHEMPAFCDRKARRDAFQRSSFVSSICPQWCAGKSARFVFCLHMHTCIYTSIHAFRHCVVTVTAAIL